MSVVSLASISTLFVIQSKKNFPRPPPIITQMIIYPLYDITSNITMYATPSETAWITDRMTCCSGDARKTTSLPSTRAADTVVSKPTFATLPLFLLEEQSDKVAARAWNPLNIQSSYSLPKRRSASRTMTSKMVPMHDAAKAPWLETCHDSARKHESIVYQFHSI
ncbi:hypothetical protein VM1G_11598 [Cytospora mali]|uniref:Uncharacterized protein n=1 Tax=Cytospora mali TaxID=578113 RepID=A0A194VZM2_CYTMA|nr:hypothetical protein VM1G_11598 [Valsa mali]